jgi:hypothetical protein
MNTHCIKIQLKQQKNSFFNFSRWLASFNLQHNDLNFICSLKRTKKYLRNLF